MPKPTEFTDEAIAGWAEEQIRRADGVPEGKPIVEAAQAILLKLTSRDQSYEPRRSQLLAERVQSEGQQRAEKRLDRWKHEAAEQAYRETRPEVMRLVDQIGSMTSSPDDLAFRLAATLAIDLMSAQPGLEEEVAIGVAWNSYREAEVTAREKRFQIAQYTEPVRSAIRDIRAGRKKRAENPSVERTARAKLGM